MHVRHRDARLGSDGDLGFPENLAGFLVEGTKHRLAAITFAGEQQRLGDDDSCARLAAGFRDVDSSQQGVILDLRRCIAIGDLPDHVAFVEIDRGNPSVGWFDNRQPLNRWGNARCADHLDIRLPGLRLGQAIHRGIGSGG